MNNVKLTEKEIERLEKIEDALGWRFTTSVKEHFNAAGKLQAFVDAATPDEKREQAKSFGPIMKSTLMGDVAKSSRLAIRNAEIFMIAAQRVASEAEVAGLLPKEKFKAEDVVLLEKCELKTVAGLVKLRLQ